MCQTGHMATNLKIDDALLNAALKLGGRRTKRETVNLALEEFVLRRRQRELFLLEGTIDFDPEYDYKAERRRK